MKRYKNHKEKSKERNTKLKCMVKNRVRERLTAENHQNFISLSPNPNNKKYLKNTETIPDGEIEEARNLNDELNKILNRLNSGSNIGVGSQHSVDANYVNKATKRKELLEKHNNKKNNLSNNFNRTTDDENINMNKV
jgi:hypothetical protein